MSDLKDLQYFIEEGKEFALSLVMREAIDKYTKYLQALAWNDGYSLGVRDAVANAQNLDHKDAINPHNQQSHDPEN